MQEPVIACPHCRAEFKLTESLAGPLLAEARQRHEREIAQRAEDFRRREVALKRQAEATAAEAQAARDRALAEAQKAQAEFLRRQRALEDEKRAFDLTVEQRIAAEAAGIRAAARKEADDAALAKVGEKETVIRSMQRQIEELKRKAEQGSQQVQGEAQELMLEETLRSRFPLDRIEPVGKGRSGGDIVQHVLAPSGQVCGAILWESKQTKVWSDTWLPKLRADQRTVKADIALMVSRALPKDMEASFDLREGVWVAEPRCAIPVAVSLRETLIALHAARQAGEGIKSKAVLTYDYLTGPRFRQRLEAIIEQFNEMQSDLGREKRALQKLWAKREAQIDAVLGATAGLYGDLQGIAGQRFPEIGALDLMRLDSEP